MQGIILWAGAGVTVSAMATVSALSVNTQRTDQEAICAPWSQEWDVSERWRNIHWYR